ncbi:hypothetical protein ACFSNO_23435 [Streptomyces cirratus]
MNVAGDGDAAALLEAAGPLPDGTGRVLVVLDGCDHAARPAAAGAATALLADPRVVVLATALEPLGVYGEQLLPLAPLPVPAPGPRAAADPEELQEVPGVALFVRRARDADPSFALTLENAGAVVELCTLLGGLPLAVELAARRLRLFPPHLLLSRLRGRTTALGGGPERAPERHRSLAALAEWSCRGLDPAATGVLRQLSVYEPGFCMPAAGGGGRGRRRGAAGARRAVGGGCGRGARGAAPGRARAGAFVLPGRAGGVGRRGRRPRRARGALPAAGGLRAARPRWNGTVLPATGVGGRGGQRVGRAAAAAGAG